MECYGIGIRGPVGPPGLLTSTAPPVLTRLMSGGGRNDLPGLMGQFRRRLAIQAARTGLALDEVLGLRSGPEHLLFGLCLCLCLCLCSIIR